MRNEPRTSRLLAGLARTGALLHGDRRPASGEQQRAFASLGIDGDGQDGGLPLIALTPGEQAVMPPTASSSTAADSDLPGFATTA